MTCKCLTAPRHTPLDFYSLISKVVHVSPPRTQAASISWHAECSEVESPAPPSSLYPWPVTPWPESILGPFLISTVLWGLHTPGQHRSRTLFYELCCNSKSIHYSSWDWPTLRAICLSLFSDNCAQVVGSRAQCIPVARATFYFVGGVFSLCREVDLPFDYDFRFYICPLYFVFVLINN